MITTKFTITPYLAEYLFGKFYKENTDHAIAIPDDYDLYHVIWDFMQPRPKNATPVDEGNVTLYLPDRRVGKNPEVYNYISVRAASAIDKYVRNMFNVELHSIFLANEKMGHYMNNIDVAYRFLAKYRIDSLTADAVLKNFYRYRENMRQRNKRKERKTLLINSKNAY